MENLIFENEVTIENICVYGQKLEFGLKLDLV